MTSRVLEHVKKINFVELFPQDVFRSQVATYNSNISKL